MTKLGPALLASTLIVLVNVPAKADRSGPDDPTIGDRGRIEVHHRYPGDDGRRPPDRGYRYIERCYWSFKTTDGWWPMGATQSCSRVRLK